MKRVITVVLVCISLMVLFTAPAFACCENCTASITQNPWALCRDVAIICAGMVTSIWIISRMR